jgi:hypothetical protein
MEGENGGKENDGKENSRIHRSIYVSNSDRSKCDSNTYIKHVSYIDNDSYIHNHFTAGDDDESWASSEEDRKAISAQPVDESHDDHDHRQPGLSVYVSPASMVVVECAKLSARTHRCLQLGHRRRRRRLRTNQHQ